MDSRGAQFASATSQFFDRFAERLEPLQKQKSSSTAASTTATGEGDDGMLTKAQCDQLITVFARWYKALSASSTISGSTTEASQPLEPSSSRKRQRDFSFVRGECGEVVTQLPHTRLIPTEWQSQSVHASAPPFASSAASAVILEDATHASRPEATLLAAVATTLAPLSPLYQAYFLLLRTWYKDRAVGRGRASELLLRASQTFSTAWLGALTALADGETDKIIRQEQCIAAAVQTVLPTPEEKTTTASPAAVAASSSPIDLSHALVTAAASLFFNECERLSADGRPLAFGSGALPLTAVVNLLSHIQQRTREVVQMHQKEGTVPHVQRRRLRVGTLVAQCMGDPRRADGVRGNTAGTGGGEVFVDDEDGEDDGMPDGDENSNNNNDGNGDDDADELESVRSLSSYSLTSEEDAVAEKHNTPPPRESPRGRPLQRTFVQNVGYAADDAIFDDEDGDEAYGARGRGRASCGGGGAAPRPQPPPQGARLPADQVTLSEAWRQHVTECRCAGLLSVLLTTYVVDVAEAELPRSAEAVYSVGAEQRCVFEGAAVARPEYAARKGSLHWFLVGRSQRPQNQTDGPG